MTHGKALTRRAALGTAALGTAALGTAALGTAWLAAPSIGRAQSKSAPIRIGLLSDVAGPYRNAGGIGGEVATELAVEDIGGSVLGRPIEVYQADIQNKPDLASAQARQWLDDGFNLLVDGAATSSGLAIGDVARAKKAIFIGNGPASSEQQGKYCSPFGFHFWGDTYSLTRGVGGELTKAGGTTWFFITADYQFGYSLQANCTRFIEAAGGRVLGSVKAPLGNTDFSSALLAAKASGAKVVAFANAGTDLQNCIKQAAEFGIVKGGQSLATLLMFISDVALLGQNVCEGLVLSNTFYWDMNEATRTWTARFNKKFELPPNMLQASNYSGVLHWLKAVRETGSLDGPTVASAMHKMPVDDVLLHDVTIAPNGQALVPVYVWRVKPAAEAKHKWDFYSKIATVPGKDAFMPLAETGCSLT